MPVEVVATIEFNVEEFELEADNGYLDFTFDFNWVFRLSFLIQLLLGFPQINTKDRLCLNIGRPAPVLTVPIIGWIGSIIPSFKLGAYAGLRACLRVKRASSLSRPDGDSPKYGNRVSNVAASLPTRLLAILYRSFPLSTCRVPPLIPVHRMENWS